MFNRQTIMLVDDDPIIRETLESWLSPAYDVLLARDGLEATYLFEQEQQRIAAIVTDLDMPRLNGGLLTEWIHHINPRLPIILMSGGFTTDELNVAQLSTATNFLAKPFEPMTLLSLLNDALGDCYHNAA